MCGFFKGDCFFRFIDFSFHFFTRYASMEKGRQLSVWSLPLFFFHSCSYFSSFPQPSAQSFETPRIPCSFTTQWSYTEFGGVSKLCDLRPPISLSFLSNLSQTWVTYRDSNMFIRWLHFGMGRSKVKVTERRNRKKTASSISLSFLLNVSQSWLVQSHWVVNYYKTCSGP